MKHYVIKWINKEKNKSTVMLTANDIVAVLCRFEREHDNANQITSIELVGITVNGIYYNYKQQ